MDQRYVTSRAALASEAFVRQEEALGVELTKGSDFERALALLITQRLTKTPRWFSGGSVFGASFDGVFDCISCAMPLSASLI